MPDKWFKIRFWLVKKGEKDLNFTSNTWQSVLPENWEDRSMITLVGTTGASGIASNIVVTHQKISPDVSIEDFAQYQREAIEQEIPDVDVLEERSFTLNGSPAFQRLQQFAYENQSIRQVQTFILGGGYIYVITGTSASEDFDASIGAFKEFTDNFRLSK